jgi:hypothetical protein
MTSGLTMAGAVKELVGVVPTKAIEAGGQQWR